MRHNVSYRNWASLLALVTITLLVAGCAPMHRHTPASPWPPERQAEIPSSTAAQQTTCERLTYGGQFTLLNPPLADLGLCLGREITAEELWDIARASGKYKGGHGGSGGFQRNDEGNVVFGTNLHVVSDCVAAASKACAVDFNKSGFWAELAGGDFRCPGASIWAPRFIHDVTTERAEAFYDLTNAGKTMSAASREAENRLVKKYNQDNLECLLEEAYGGARHHINCYRVYRDVRLHWSCPWDLCDAHNFDIRPACDKVELVVYEDNEPAKIEDFLETWTGPLQEGQFLLAMGYPGNANRARLTSFKNVYARQRAKFYNTLMSHEKVGLEAYLTRTAVPAPQSAEKLLTANNNILIFRGQLRLLDQLVAKQQVEDDGLRVALLGAGLDAERFDEIRSKLDDIEHKLAQITPEAYLLYHGYLCDAEEFTAASTLIDLEGELNKPDAERLSAFTEANRATLTARMLAAQPTDSELDATLCVAGLATAREFLPSDDPLQRTLAERDLLELARSWTTNSKLDEVAYRQKLYEGLLRGESLNGVEDPFLDLARKTRGRGRVVYETRRNLEEERGRLYKELAALRFSLYGEGRPPDTTGESPRLAFGPISGGRNEDGTTFGPFLTLGDNLTHEATHRGTSEPLLLHPVYHDRALDPEVQATLITEIDTISGQSGSGIYAWIDGRWWRVATHFDGNRARITNELTAGDPCCARGLEVAEVGINELKQVMRLMEARIPKNPF